MHCAYLVLVSSLLVVTSFAFVAPKCRSHEVYKSCGTCEPSCEDLKPVCFEGCGLEGCYCEEGYVRTFSGRCVLPSECGSPDPPQTNNVTCGEHETFTNCGNCEQMCENPWGAPGQACPYACGQMCICQEGYVRDWDMKCIKKDECTPHPECAHVTCPSGTRCVWAPQLCTQWDCPQVVCMPPYVDH
uniref:TIL domain-containing protein n=1 Tax=Steinernema glaseri TaxID=37863 RepID=A0A1I7YSE4_9BILA